MSNVTVYCCINSNRGNRIYYDFLSFGIFRCLLFLDKETVRHIQRWTIHQKYVSPALPIIFHYEKKSAFEFSVDLVMSLIWRDVVKNQKQKCNAVKLQLPWTLEAVILWAVILQIFWPTDQMLFYNIILLNLA